MVYLKRPLTVIMTAIAVFYNILDFAGINAFVLYKKRTSNKVSRRDFIFKLDTELREDDVIKQKRYDC